jgi:hypothetical protein
MKTPEQKDISSAEMTAVYRAAFPQISGDRLSQLLVNEAGRVKA